LGIVDGELGHHGLLDYLPAILDQLGGYGDVGAPGLDVVGLRTGLAGTARVLDVAGVGLLEDRHALAGVVAAVADVDRLLDVAAFGFLADFVLEAAPPAGGSFVFVVVCAITPAGVVCGPDPLLMGAAVIGVRPAAEAQELQQLAVRERLEPLAEGPATGYLGDRGGAKTPGILA